MLIEDVITILDEWFPPELANIDDRSKIGFTIGSKKQPLKHILLALDLTKEVVEEAITLHANLIIAHHPFPYYPLESFLDQDKHTQILNLMLNHHISFYSAHTNMDVGLMGVNDVLANQLDLQQIQGMVKRDQYLRFGEIQPITLEKYCAIVKEKLQISTLKVVGSANKIIKRVGIVGGSGCHLEEINQAIENHCDLYITGEFKLSMVQYADFHQLAMIEIPHGTEKMVLNQLQIRLQNRLETKYEVNISDINTDPIWFI